MMVMELYEQAKRYFRCFLSFLVGNPVCHQFQQNTHFYFFQDYYHWSLQVFLLMTSHFYHHLKVIAHCLYQCSLRNIYFYLVFLDLLLKDKFDWNILQIYQKDCLVEDHYCRLMWYNNSDLDPILQLDVLISAWYDLLVVF